MIGALLSAIGLLVLGFTKEIVSCFVQDEETVKSLTILAAVLAIYSVDFTINVGTCSSHLTASISQLLR
jgi:solute carrier family 45, member 1/2/4